MRTKRLPIFCQSDARRIVDESCKEHGIQISLLEDLVELERENIGRARRDGINDELDAILGEHLTEAEEQLAS